MPLDSPSIEFPKAFQPLFQPARYKVYYGGRGGARSWSFARALLLIGVQRPIRVLCVRELQKSLDESVHKLLSDQIKLLGLEDFYDIQVGRIIGPNGTSFAFEGIKNNTKKVKSYEGVDYCWVEEAEGVSKASWNVLIPTVRKEGSEIWISFNPALETDYTYVRFVKEPSAGAIVVKTSWRDNPWFPETLREEMEDLKARDYDTYLNVWEGFCLQMLEGVVFAKELRRCQEEHRIMRVPWDRESPVNTYWDLGRRDMTSIWFAQHVAMQNRVLGYYEGQGEDIHHYLKHLQGLPYLYGEHYLPHDASHKRLGEKRSIEQIVKAVYPGKVHVVPRTLKKVNAINAARLIFPNCYFDDEECVDGLQRLRHYRYKIVEGQYSADPLHDENSNGADAFMTMAQELRPEVRKRDRSGLLDRFRKSTRPDSRGQSWMRH